MSNGLKEYHNGDNGLSELENAERQQRLWTEVEQRAYERLRNEVQRLTPEVLLSPENTEHIRSQYLDGIELQAQLILNDILTEERPVVEVVLENAWDIQSLIRTVLTDPLPVEQIFSHYEGDEIVAPADVWVADTVHWWAELTDKQKFTISKIIGIPLHKFAEYKPPPEKIGGRHLLWRPKKPLVAEEQELTRSTTSIEPGDEEDEPLVSGEEDLGFYLPEVTFYPVLVWNPDHGVVVSALPVEYVRRFNRELSQDTE